MKFDQPLFDDNVRSIFEEENVDRNDDDSEADEDVEDDEYTDEDDDNTESNAGTEEEASTEDDIDETQSEGSYTLEENDGLQHLIRGFYQQSSNVNEIVSHVMNAIKRFMDIVEESAQNSHEVNENPGIGSMELEIIVSLSDGNIDVSIEILGDITNPENIP